MTRRILSLWLPRLGAERRLRREGPDRADAPLATAAEIGPAMRLASLSASAEEAGLRPGMALADARALLPSLRVAPAEPLAEAALLAGLGRWAGRYSPWVGLDGTDALALDVSGCAHLFGGEAALLADMRARLERIGFTARPALADSKGAAWALARFSRSAEPPIAPAGGTLDAIAALPPAALRLEPKVVEALARLGLRDIGALARLPRASVARRFGAATLRRLDQALGAEPEPVAPSAPPPVYAVRLSLPEPVGRLQDLAAGLERLLTRLCARLEADAMGARRLRFFVRRVDHGVESVEIGLARSGRDPERIAPLFEKQLAAMKIGLGVDALRLQATAVEPLGFSQIHAGPDRAELGAPKRAMDDLLTRLGLRLGLDRLLRLLPAESWAPDKAAITAAAAWSQPAQDWLVRAAARPERPLSVFAPEPIEPRADAEPLRPPPRFRWRGREHHLTAMAGPERISPEWWLDDPGWRSGLRDYWRVRTEEGARLWMFHTPQAQREPRWFAAGLFG